MNRYEEIKDQAIRVAGVDKADDLIRLIGLFVEAASYDMWTNGVVRVQENISDDDQVQRGAAQVRIGEAFREAAWNAVTEAVRATTEDRYGSH